jgi:hypothetical protein
MVYRWLRIQVLCSQPESTDTALLTCRELDGRTSAANAFDRLGFRVGNPSAIGWYQRANFPASLLPGGVTPTTRRRIATLSLRRKMARSPSRSGGWRTRLQHHRKGQKPSPAAGYFFARVDVAGALPLPFAHTGKSCSLIPELPAGRAEVLQQRRCRRQASHSGLQIRGLPVFTSRLRVRSRARESSGPGDWNAMKLPRRTFLHLAAGAAALPVVSHIARAQAYPTRIVMRVFSST